MINTPYLYKGFTLNDTPRIYHLISIDGFDSPGLREVRENRPGMHGQIDYANLLGERLLILNGKILAGSVSERNNRRQPFIDAFKTDGEYDWLKFQVSGDIAKQIYCKVIDLKIDDSFEYDFFTRDFTINLLAVDPLIYSQSQENKKVYIPSTEGGFIFPITFPFAFGTVQTGGKIVCSNDGNFPTLPVVKLFGPLTNPKIRNNDDEQKEILINMEVSAGDWLEINFLEKTIMLNSTASRYNYLSSDSKWWVIKPGNNEIEFRDSLGNTTAYAEIVFRSAWV